MPAPLVAVLAAPVVVVGFAALGRNAQTERAPTRSEMRIETLRVVWNGLIPQTRLNICRDVAIRGADVVAYDIMEAAEEFSMESHDDVEWFLTEPA